MHLTAGLVNLQQLRLAGNCVESELHMRALSPLTALRDLTITGAALDQASVHACFETRSCKQHWILQPMAM